MTGIAVIGAGNRARKYLQCLPGDVEVRFLVEPDPLRLSIAAGLCGVPAPACFSSASELFAVPRDISAVIVAAPDRLHVPLSLMAVQRGLHVLVEKPVATSEEGYRSLLDASSKTGVQVGVCLEMRFHPFFRRIKQIVESGVLGQVLEIDHTEHIGPDRMAHTFVRGLWSKEEESGPIFLSKCCHDADFLLWLVGGNPVEVRSSGSLQKFVRDASAPDFCVDCSRTGCPYSAVSLYRERGEWTDGFDVPKGSTLRKVIDAELSSGRYGRCVYKCDNNVFDTQDVDVLLSGGIQLHMHMEGTSLQEGRTTRIVGGRGVLVADKWTITVRDSAGKILSEEDFSSLASQPLHAGADKALVHDFFAAIASGRTPSATLASAFSAHRLCWLAG